ncbi:MAG: pterin-4-alpha-carbinolamine dehydratase [Actinobacteria bacterium]|nr:pterin-4-alpha-carbinolamine dehydratase [Actinomycetota bacterium]
MFHRLSNGTNCLTVELLLSRSKVGLDTRASSYTAGRDTIAGVTSTRLTEDQINELLREHPDWARNGDGVERTFEVGSFVAAFGFMSSVALVSERLFHHPEWSNIYGTVHVRITDHDAGGISTNDLAWIERVDALL